MEARKLYENLTQRASAPEREIMVLKVSKEVKEKVGALAARGKLSKSAVVDRILRAFLEDAGQWDLSAEDQDDAEDLTQVSRV